MTQLLRVHGSENTFFLLDQKQLTQKLTIEELQRLTQAITKEHGGLMTGADGMLIVDDSEHVGVAGKMTVVNSDGSIASMCGNGLRTVSRYLSEQHNIEDFIVETDQADLQVGRATDFANGVPTFRVEISPVNFEIDSLPMTLKGHTKLVNEAIPGLVDNLKFSAVAVPNPHLISIEHDEKQLSQALLGKLGYQLNQPNPWFADGVNVSFGTVWGPNEMFVQTYERGVGFTNACGTGMSATSLIWSLLDDGLTGVEQLNTIYNPGGMVQTIVHQKNDQYSIDLIGNATNTHQIEIDEQQLRNLDFTDAVITETGEENDYQRFVKA